jgi:hypothetical protein
MVGIAVRNFDCDLCRQSFSRQTGDLIIPGDAICDDCITEISRLDGDALTEFVAQQLATNYPEYGEKRRENTLGNVQWFKKHRLSASQN